MKKILPYLTKSKRERGYSRKYIDTLVRLFESKQLPKEMRTNHAHLIIGLGYGLKYKLGICTKEEVMILLRDAIVAHNESVGIENTQTSGYHETITKFREETLTQYVLEHRSNDLYSIANDLLDSKYGDSGYITTYYSKEVLKSTEARKKYVKPDLVQS